MSYKSERINYKLLDLPIGFRFVYRDNAVLEVTKKQGCKDCYFRTSRYKCWRSWASALECTSSRRFDGKDVSFVRIGSAMINEKHYG